MARTLEFRDMAGEALRLRRDMAGEELRLLFPFFLHFWQIRSLRAVTFGLGNVFPQVLHVAGFFFFSRWQVKLSR